MRDATRDAQAPDVELVAEPACCPGGVCGPIFETPLLELAFNRVRDLVRGRNAANVVEMTTEPPLNPLLPTSPVAAAAPPRLQKDASHD